MADAIRYINDADHFWTALERVEFRRQEENDATYPENEREARTREAASVTRNRATRPAQWYTRPDASQETGTESTSSG